MEDENKLHTAGNPQTEDDNPFAAAFAGFEEQKSDDTDPFLNGDPAAFANTEGRRAQIGEPRRHSDSGETHSRPAAPEPSAQQTAGDDYSFQIGGENYSVQNEARNFSFDGAAPAYAAPAAENAYDPATQTDGYGYPAEGGYGYPAEGGYDYPADDGYGYPIETDDYDYDADPEEDDTPRRQFAFKVRNLTKDYDGHTVLNNISFDIPAGKIVGLLGPNGCGKTTLIKILTGLIKDYTGVVKVGGRSIGIVSKAHLAYLPDNTYFPGRFRTIDCIKYYADYFEDFDRIKAAQFASDFGLDLNQRVKTMSKGMQEKLQLLVVMSRKADIYVLDEPLGGVDPAARGVILDIIMNNYKENATILLSTHLVNDLEHSFDHVLMLGKGAVLVNTGIDTLRATGKSVEEIFKEVIGDAWEVD